MEFQKIKPDEMKLPKCEALLSLETRQHWKGKGRPGNPNGKSTCDCQASYKINGKTFCRKHAGLHLLDTIDEDYSLAKENKIASIKSEIDYLERSCKQMAYALKDIYNMHGSMEYIKTQYRKVKSLVEEFDI